MGCKLIFGLLLLYHSTVVHKFSKNPGAALKFYASDYDTKLPYCRPKNIRRHRQKLNSHDDQVTEICASLPDDTTFYLRRPKSLDNKRSETYSI